MKKRLTVDIWYYGYLNASNGVASFIRSMVSNSLIQDSINLSVFCLSDSAFSEVKESNGHGVLKNKIKKFVYFLSTTFPVFAYLFIRLTSVRNIKSVLKRHPQSSEDTILFFNDLISFYFYFMKYKNAKNMSVLVLHNNGDPLKMVFDSFPLLKKSILAKRFFKNIVDFSIHRANKIVVLSEVAKGIFLQKFNSLGDRVCVINNGVNSGAFERLVFGENDNKVKFVCIGTVGYRKGHDLLIDALEYLDESELSNCLFDIIGDGPLKNELKERVESSGKFSNIVRFLGNIPNASRCLNRYDVFILTSRDEGMPIAVIEAMRDGLALILTDAGAMCEMVTNNFNGYLAELSPISISNAISLMLKNKSQIIKFRENSRNRFLERYDEGIMIGKYLKVFEELNESRLSKTKN